MDIAITLEDYKTMANSVKEIIQLPKEKCPLLGLLTVSMEETRREAGRMDNYLLQFNNN
jgi:hypothetical protein